MDKVSEQKIKKYSQVRENITDSKPSVIKNTDIE
jgi:hypothetical protein